MLIVAVPAGEELICNCAVWDEPEGTVKLRVPGVTVMTCALEGLASQIEASASRIAETVSLLTNPPYVHTPARAPVGTGEFRELPAMSHGRSADLKASSAVCSPNAPAPEDRANRALRPGASRAAA
jgi:hypothetical protein